MNGECQDYWNIEPSIKNPDKYYENWKTRYPGRSILSVSDYKAHLEKKTVKYDRGELVVSGYNHILGKIQASKIATSKKEKVINPKLKGKALFHPSNLSSFSQKFRFILLQDFKSEDSIRIIVNNVIGEMLFRESLGEKILLFFTHTSSGGWITPLHYHYFFDIGSVNENKLQRDNHRIKTYHLYPKVYKRDGYQCRKCGNKERKELSIHHRNYDNFATDNQAMEAMMTLCNDCHNGITFEQVKGQQLLSKY